MEKIIYNMFSFVTLCLMAGSYILLKQERLLIIGLICIVLMQIIKNKYGK